MSELTEALKRIKTWIEINTPFYDDFNPGLTSAQIYTLLKDSPFKLTREVRELYEFFDGGVELFPFWGFYSLEEAIKNYYVWVEVYCEDCEPRHQLPLFWLAGEYYVICEEEEIDSSPVWFRPKGEEPILAYSSLTSLIQMMAECYETGAYFIWTAEHDIEYFGEDFGELMIYSEYHISQLRQFWEEGSFQPLLSRVWCRALEQAIAPEELSEEEAAYIAKPILEEDFEKSNVIFKKYNPDIGERQDL